MSMLTTQWALDLPEIATRPEALRVMLENENLRRAVLRIVNDLLGTATRMRGHQCAREVLASMWATRKRGFHRSWDGRISNDAFAQCFGVLRNLYLNAVVRASGDAWTPTYRVHDVARPVPAWMESA